MQCVRHSCVRQAVCQQSCSNMAQYKCLLCDQWPCNVTDVHARQLAGTWSRVWLNLNARVWPAGPSCPNSAAQTSPASAPEPSHPAAAVQSSVQCTTLRAGTISVGGTICRCVYNTPSRYRAQPARHRGCLTTHNTLLACSSYK